MPMRCIFLLSLVAVGTAFAAEESAEKPVSADIAKAAKEFPEYKKMLAEPKSIGAEFVTLCMIPPPVQELKKKNGPHYGVYVQHYRNAVALVSRGHGPWPEGSVLVKEKLVKGWPHARPGETRRAGIAGMIKRAPGTKPETGDWEFFWVQDEKVKTSGMQSCAGCHSGAARDYVFTSFPTAVEKLQDAGKLNPR